jgi:hypothetical protein
MTGDCDDIREKPRFFTVAPDPWLSVGGGLGIKFYPTTLNLQLTASWTTVWVDDGGNATFQGTRG